METKINDLLAKVPGYSGYRVKEDQRDEDKRLRVAIADALDGVVAQLTRAGSKLVTDKAFDKITQIESALADTRHLADRIRNTTYGYGGIFTDRSIDDVALEQLRLFDVALQREVQALAPLASDVGVDGVDAYRAKLDELTQLFGSRNSVVDQGKPTQDQKVLTVLEKPTEATPSVLLGARVGDALSVMGDNFTVDATIVLSYQGSQIKLVRIVEADQQGERWLLGSSSTEQWPTADLHEVSGERALATTSSMTQLPARMAITGPQGDDSSIPVSYGLSQSGDDSITLEISFGNDRKVFVGTRLNDMDVEYYGPTGK